MPQLPLLPPHTATILAAAVWVDRRLPLVFKKWAKDNVCLHKVDVSSKIQIFTTAERKALSDFSPLFYTDSASKTGGNKGMALSQPPNAFFVAKQTSVIE